MRRDVAFETKAEMMIYANELFWAFTKSFIIYALENNQ
jgi:hypothetical protein